MEGVPVVDLALRVGATEGQELLGDEPVEVSVLDALVVLVLLAVKVVEVEEARILRALDRPVQKRTSSFTHIWIGLLRSNSSLHHKIAEDLLPFMVILHGKFFGQSL